MQRIFRLILFVLLFPAMIAALYLESKLQLSSGGHGLVQAGIVVVTCWLAWRWLIYNEMSNLRELGESKPPRYHYRIVPLLEDVETPRREPVSRPLEGTAQAAAGGVAPLPEQRAINLPVSLARVARALAAVGIVFSLTVVLLLIGSTTLGQGVIAILYLLPIGWCTVRWGQTAGVSAALTAGLSFDYLFIPPYRTFNIGSLEGWLLLFLFLATATLVVGRIQSILTDERERERKATFLYEIVAAMASQATREGIARAIAYQIQQKFLAESVQVRLNEGWGNPSFTARANNRYAFTPGGRPDRALTIASGAAEIGEISIWKGPVPLPADEDLVLQTMLMHTAAAFERVREAEGKPPYPRQKPALSEGNSLQPSHKDFIC